MHNGVICDSKMTFGRSESLHEYLPDKMGSSCPSSLNKLKGVYYFILFPISKVVAHKVVTVGESKY